MRCAVGNMWCACRVLELWAQTDVHHVPSNGWHLCGAHVRGGGVRGDGVDRCRGGHLLIVALGTAAAVLVVRAVLPASWRASHYPTADTVAP